MGREWVAVERTRRCAYGATEPTARMGDFLSAHYKMALRIGKRHERAVPDNAST